MIKNNQFYDQSVISLRNNETYQLDNDSRPDSSKLVDLHVYILPRNFWLTKQNLAYNETILESISAGFIRILKDTILVDLRSEIRKQCKDEVPKEYVFLKSVGRALTRVKPNQELELKVKNFMPPYAIGPEIFLLEVDKEITQKYLNKFDQAQSMRNLRNDIQDDLNSRILPDIINQRFPKHENFDMSQNNFNKPFTSSRENINKYSTLDNRDFDKLKEEQERLKQRQIELERLRNQQLERLKNRQRNDENLNGYNRIENGFSKVVNFDSDTIFDRNGHKSYENENDLANEIKRQKELELKNKSALLIQNAYRGYKDRLRLKELNKSKLDDLFENDFELNDNNDLIQTDTHLTSVEVLKDKLKKIKQKRIEIESQRDDLIKHLKTIHNRITLRRKETRDLWKKKYFSEKKKTPDLEEKVNSLLEEIDSLQKKMFSSFESDIKSSASNGYMRESDIKFGWLTSLKLEEEIFLLKRQLDQSKLKLSTDIKLRNQAEIESRALKNELLQTKMNLVQLKNNS